MVRLRETGFLEKRPGSESRGLKGWRDDPYEDAR